MAAPSSTPSDDVEGDDARVHDHASTAWRESAVRTAVHAYELAHGSAIGDRRAGLRWAPRPRLVIAVVTALGLLAVVMLLGPSRAAVTVAQPSTAPGPGAEATPVADVHPEGIESAPLSIDDTVVVHVAGEVVSPGLVELPAGARVADAVDAAGGPTTRAELDAINLARAVHDGEQILVPEQGSALADAGADAAAGDGAPVSVSTATASQLESLPGIGPVIAARIVDDRETHGPYSSLADLTRVSGVGDVLVAGLDGLAVP